jgi:DNA-binding protein H-NS
MTKYNLKMMTVDELWQLHESVVGELSSKMAVERAKLEGQLRRLGSIAGDGGTSRERRPYPKVLPKYSNPKNRSETWTGRGKQPSWVRDQIRSGKKLNDFLIAKAST